MFCGQKCILVVQNGELLTFQQSFQQSFKRIVFNQIFNGGEIYAVRTV